MVGGSAGSSASLTAATLCGPSAAPAGFESLTQNVSSPASTVESSVSSSSMVFLPSPGAKRKVPMAVVNSERSLAVSASVAQSTLAPCDKSPARVTSTVIKVEPSSASKEATANWTVFATGVGEGVGAGAASGVGVGVASGVGVGVATGVGVGVGDGAATWTHLENSEVPEAALAVAVTNVPGATAGSATANALSLASISR